MATATASRSHEMMQGCKPGPLPHDCPECGSADTVEKYEGDPTCRECIACESFWYERNARTHEWESVPGRVRRRAN